MPMVELNYNDLEILIREYDKQEEELNKQIHRLRYIINDINKLKTNVGEDIFKDKDYVSRDSAVADLKEADAQLDEIKHKVWYFMRTVRESLHGTNSSEESIKGE